MTFALEKHVRTFVKHKIYAIMIASLIMVSSSLAEVLSPIQPPDKHHQLLQALQYAEIFRITVQRTCQLKPQVLKDEPYATLCTQIATISDDIIERASLPYITIFLSEDETSKALKFWTSSYGVLIQHKLILEMKTNNPTLLSSGDLSTLDIANKSSYGQALLRFAKNTSSSIAIIRDVTSTLAINGAQNVHTPEGNETIRKLSGMWCPREKKSDDCIEHMEIRIDGTVMTCSYLPGNHQMSRSTSTIKVIGKSICFTVTKTDNPSTTPLGYSFCFELQELNENYMRVKVPKLGQIFTSYRLPPGTPECPASAY